MSYRDELRFTFGFKSKTVDAEYRYNEECQTFVRHSDERIHLFTSNKWENSNRRHGREKFSSSILCRKIIRQAIYTHWCRPNRLGSIEQNDASMHMKNALNAYTAQNHEKNPVSIVWIMHFESLAVSSKHLFALINLGSAITSCSLKCLHKWVQSGTVDRVCVFLLHFLPAIGSTCRPILSEYCNWLNAPTNHSEVFRLVRSMDQWDVWTLIDVDSHFSPDCVDEM